MIYNHKQKPGILWEGRKDTVLETYPVPFSPPIYIRDVLQLIYE